MKILLLIAALIAVGCSCEPVPAKYYTIEIVFIDESKDTITVDRRPSMGNHNCITAPNGIELVQSGVKYFSILKVE